MLDHPYLEQFEPTLRRLFRAAHTTGKHALEATGRSMQEIVSDKELGRRFLKACHKGYDDAQRKTADEVIRLTNDIANAKAQIVELRKRSDAKSEIRQIIGAIRTMELRILVLRRLMDSIAFTLFQERTWITRRFVIHDETNPIDAEAIRKALRVANSQNNLSRYTFTLVSDLTTYIQVGDLIRLDCRDPSRKWKIIELKEGKVNELISGLLDEKEHSLNDEDLSELRNRIGKHAPKQALRMLKQKERQDNIEKIVLTDQGMSTKAGIPLRLPHAELIHETYDKALYDCITQAKSGGFGGCVVDDCLMVLALSKEEFHNPEFVARHNAYHTLNPAARCEFETSDEMMLRKEIERIQSIPFAVNLVRSNLYAGSSRPIFAYPLEEDLLMDLLFGRICVLLVLNLESFLKLYSREGFKTGFSSKSEAAEMKRQFGNEAITYENRLIWIEDQQGRKVNLFGGTFSRIFHDLTRPSELVRLQKEEVFREPT